MPAAPEGNATARDLIVIPARYGSKRLPGKPLALISGRTLLERVVGIARRAAAIAGDTTVVVATDDARIEAHAIELGCVVAMTAETISTGSGRACAVALARPTPPDIVVNLQGDAPFIAPETVATLISTARASDAAVATPVVRLDWESLDRLREHKRLAPFSGTTCTRRDDGRALWFSKAIIPALRDERMLRHKMSASPVYRHLGLYAYRLSALQAFERTPPSPYELLEGLEQLRFLEMGLEIVTVEVAPVAHAMSGIDTAEDVALAETLIARHGDPHVAWA